MRPTLPRASIACVLLVYAIWGLWYIDRTSFVVAGEVVHTLWDDGMISMRYARNLAQGDGLSWNAEGDRVQGFSNPAVTLIMAAVHLLPISPTRASFVIQTLALVLLLGVVYGCWLLTRELVAETPFVAIASAVSVALFSPLAVWGLQGSDVAFVALWLTLGVTLTARYERQGTAWPDWLYWVLALGLWLRWDAALYYGVLLGVSLWGRPGWRQGLVHGMSASAVMLVALMGASWLYYGDPLANTFYLKGTGTPAGLRIQYALAQLSGWGLASLPLLGIAGYAVWVRRRSRAIVSAGALVASSLLYNVWIGGDWSQEYGSRFLAQVLPLLAVLGTLGLWELGQRVLREPAPGHWLAHTSCLVASAMLVLAASPQSARQDWLSPGAETMYRRQNEENYSVALYMRDHTAPSTTLALHAAGVLGYFAERSAIDVLGRSDRHIARLEVDRFEPGHSKWDWDYVVNERRPDIIVYASRGLARRPDFRSSYLRATRPIRPSARDYDRRSFFIRTDSLDKLLDPEVELQHQRPRRG